MNRRAKLSLSALRTDVDKRPEGLTPASPSSPTPTRKVGRERATKPLDPPPSSIAAGDEKRQPPPTGTPSLNQLNANDKRLQSLTTEEFFYFFLRMRKGEVKRVVGLLQAKYPEEGPGQLSKRLIASKSRLALLGGTLVSLPWLLPGVGQSLKLAGVVGATSMLTRMNLYLINEIALAFGEDIDDTARVSDMMAVVGATAISTAAPGLIAESLGLNPWLQLPAGAFASAGMTQLIGHAAIRHFRSKAMSREDMYAEPALPASS